MQKNIDFSKGRFRPFHVTFYRICQRVRSEGREPLEKPGVQWRGLCRPQHGEVSEPTPLARLQTLVADLELAQRAMLARFNAHVSRPVGTG